ncbi:Rnf-Nqr domain containing protein [Pseudomonas citrulli]|uniref:Rnf-Nqr domain containing protein n=1 Tax=Pseudomonas citrulli TaxID=3064347 RepID=A0ABT9BX88_9PSED|nr:Rnf-Nqr domain containing protein [Pseudomonas sp. K18]MDO7897168.1 Rnf-Nqr domain containing protein [Pseudomonas sp. K18]
MNKPWALTRGLLLVPLIGATASLTGALGTALAWALVTMVHGAAMDTVRHRLTAHQGLLACVVLAATLTACAGLFLKAWVPEPYRVSDLYLGWIALSCVVLERQDTFIGRRLLARLGLAGLFGLWMLGLGAARELIGRGLPLASLAPGGFILLGLLLAARQAWTAARPHSPTKDTPRS